MSELKWFPFPHRVSYDLEPLRCRTCDGSGHADGTDEYLAQLRRGGPDVYMTFGEPHLKHCRVCAGTGRHVSRARAGLAAPPIIHFDIEAMPMPDTAEALKVLQDAMDAMGRLFLYAVK